MKRKSPYSFHPHPPECPHSPTTSLSPSLSPSPHRFSEEELQLAILQHVDAGVGLSGTENVITLLTLLENHVLAKLQEQRLLKVAQHPTGTRMGTAGDTELAGTCPGPLEAGQRPVATAMEDAEGKSILQRSGPASPFQDRILTPRAGS